MQPLDVMAESTAPELNGEAAAAGHPHVSHVIPVQVLLAVFFALIVFTGVTVAITWFDLGEWNLLAALGIATVKASLVALYFMHLRYDSPFNGLLLVTALVFVALFLSLTIMDSVEYQPDIQSYQDAAPG